MSKRHPVIAITGSSGAGTTTVRHAFEQIFRRNHLNAVHVEGDAFRRYDRARMKEVMASAREAGEPFSHFGPEANLFDRLEALFRDYGETGSGLTRHYVKQENEAELGAPAGTFTEWAPVSPGSDLLFYEGLHGGVAAHTWTRRKAPRPPSEWPVPHERRGAHEGVDVARHVDLLLGVVPVVNLEWIQKIHRDSRRKGTSPEAITQTILRRLDDYIHFIVPQFSLTDINFQRVPVVDTSNPFISRDVPAPHESIVVIRFRDPKGYDFPDLLRRLDEAFMSRRNNLVVPGGSMHHALEVICGPLIDRLTGA